ncbi:MULTISPECIES: vitamin B12 dependent-methionine synthase activation domain-containing protein [unclassified Halanaerobium]|uniref:vitamin B12 dependent-methionine synthase activation domain-containing protein n=1 Tax=unclassified Halanaerobium TaxID=2641197 RepID=UPI000DF1F01A|nr:MULTISPECIES: vitamin B12 dependent-methionine synthase activation domain-containing protein [unclassified Halanaerobium]RCW47739.1 5-methyltetrahydrofolate--homocysteine methyltransferase [Halanaerobium sp. MA284_MarDTE_T2]RCW81776.1 5-methyltetrahydrofolate--homocysteine methyltransferase [Halanaerobium sp. DL-01]
MEFKIDRSEVLMYLQTSKDLKDKNIIQLISQASAEVKDLIDFRYLYKKFPIEISQKGIKLLNTTLTLKGKSIKKHLKKSPEIYLMAVTLGVQIDKKISLYDKTSVTKAVIFDACATAAVEEGCDKVEAEIKRKAFNDGYKDITFRYSPGYGDLSIEVQKELLRILNAPKKIGLTVSKYNMLQPNKSVTAVIGMLTEKTESDGEFSFEKRHCRQCNLYNDCQLRRKGNYCGTKK